METGVLPRHGIGFLEFETVSVVKQVILRRGVFAFFAVAIACFGRNHLQARFPGVPGAANRQGIRRQRPFACQVQPAVMLISRFFSHQWGTPIKRTSQVIGPVF